jgi:hypothetical protein
MLKWIWRNKEWPFSGIGVLLLIAIFSLLKRIKINPLSSKTESNAETKSIAKPATPISEAVQQNEIKSTPALLTTEPHKVLEEIESQPFF